MCFTIGAMKKKYAVQTQNALREVEATCVGIRETSRGNLVTFYDDQEPAAQFREDEILYWYCERKEQPD